MNEIKKELTEENEFEVNVEENYARVLFRNGDNRMEDIDSYAYDYGFKATKIDEYKNPYYLEWGEYASPIMDEWLLEGNKENILAFFEDYGLDYEDDEFCKWLKDENEPLIFTRFR